MNKTRLMVLGVIAGVLLAVPAAVMASHRFTDVPDTSSFHDDITWLADSGVTQGCDASGVLYCPSDNVTRQQMAAFMYRLSGNDPMVPPSVNASSALVADEATNATRAEDADLLDGRPREALLGGATGGFVGWTNAIGLESDVIQTLFTSNHTAATVQSTSLVSMFNGNLYVTTTNPTLQADHSILCWISETEWTTFDADSIDSSFAWTTMPAGTPGVAISGGSYQYAESFSITYGRHLDAGETVLLYYQCVDVAGSGTETIFANGRILAHQVADDADSFFEIDRVGVFGGSPSDPESMMPR